MDEAMHVICNFSSSFYFHWDHWFKIRSLKMCFYQYLFQRDIHMQDKLRVLI